MSLSKEDLQQEIEQLLSLYDEGDITSAGLTSKLFAFINNQLDNDLIYTDTVGIDDEMYSELKEYTKTLKTISTSVLQRRFMIGYAKASRLMEKLEEDKLVGAYSGSSEPRKVL